MTRSAQFSAMDGEMAQVPEGTASGIASCDGQWIVIELYDDEGKPVAGQAYEIRRQSGGPVRGGKTVISGTLDKAGHAREDRIRGAEECVVEFVGLGEDTEVEPVTDQFWASVEPSG